MYFRLSLIFLMLRISNVVGPIAKCELKTAECYGLLKWYFESKKLVASVLFGFGLRNWEGWEEGV
jgi:hypothetical protein